MFLGNNIDYNSATQIATIIAGANTSTVNIAVTDDNIVERNETFHMSLALPSFLGPRIMTGNITGATGTIIDTSSKYCYYFVVCINTEIVDIRVRFTSRQYIGSEAVGFVPVTLELSRGTSAYPFNVTVTPSEQSPSSAKSKQAMCIIYIHYKIFTNRWC